MESARGDLEAVAALAAQIAAINPAVGASPLDRRIAVSLFTLIDKGALDLAARVVDTLRPLSRETEAGLCQILVELLQKRSFESAIRAVNVLRLGGPGLARFCQVLLIQGQYSQALTFVGNPDACMSVAVVANAMLKAGNTEGALRLISEHGLAREFDVASLVGHVIHKENNVAGAQRFIAKFGLEAVFPAQTLLERALATSQWDFALSLLTAHPSLKSRINAKGVLECAIIARDWVSCVKLASQLGLPLTSTPSTLNQAMAPLLKRMIEGMIKDGRLYMAMRLVLAHSMEEVFPPKAIIASMIRQRQFEHALRYIRVLHLEGEFDSQLKDIHRARLEALVSFRQLVDTLKRKARPRLDDMEPGPFFIVARIALGSRPMAPLVETLPVHKEAAENVLVADGEGDEEILLPTAAKSTKPAPGSRSASKPARLVPTQIYLR